MSSFQTGDYWLKIKDDLRCSWLCWNLCVCLLALDASFSRVQPLHDGTPLIIVCVLRVRREQQESQAHADRGDQRLVLLSRLTLVCRWPAWHLSENGRSSWACLKGNPYWFNRLAFSGHKYRFLRPFFYDFNRFVFSSKGPRGERGPRGPTGKAGPKVRQISHWHFGQIPILSPGQWPWLGSGPQNGATRGSGWNLYPGNGTPLVTSVIRAKSNE